jgi:hypothetical protein
MVKYTYVAHELATDNQAIKILDGVYKNKIFTFGHVSFYEKDDEPYLKFDYNLIESDDPNTEDFVNALGDIVVDILEREFKEKPDGVFVDDTDYRKDNTTQPSKE